MKRKIARTWLGIIFAIGSFGLVLLAAMSFVLAPKARADDEARLRGTYPVAFSVRPNTGGDTFCGGSSDPSGVTVEAHGAGHSSLGDFSFSLNKTIVGPALHGCLILTAPNGDTLTAIYDGIAGTLNPNHFRDFTGTLTFTGGTGRFEGASGSADFTAVATPISGTSNPMQGIAFYLVNGTVSLQHGDQ